MSGNGAYGDEMSEVVMFEKALEVAVTGKPDSRLGRELVPRLAEAARASTIETDRQEARRGAERSRGTPGTRRAWVARVGIVVAVVPMLLAGLAFAGVRVPNPVRSAFDSVGVHLPNQSVENQGRNSTRNSTEQPSQGQSASAPDQPRGSHRRANRGRNQNTISKPGRRIRRHGTGPVPGSASPPAGKALGHAKAHGKSQIRSGGSASPASPGNSGRSPGQTGARGGGPSNGHGKPG